MKIRISGNSIRFRLKQSEVKSFKQDGQITELTAFGGDARLSFILKKGSGEDFKIDYQSDTVSIEVPEIVSNEWTTTELVGFQEEIPTGQGQTIKLLVEKDFMCMDGSDSENEDSFPNPKMQY